MKFKQNTFLIKDKFSYTAPLKGLSYINELSKDKQLSGNYYDYPYEDISPHSIYDCASNFLVYHIKVNYLQGNQDAIRIVDCYEKAAKDRIIEAANNLGVIYYELGRKDLSLSFFQTAYEGGSYYACQNLAIYYLRENLLHEYATYNTNSIVYNNPSALWNRAVSFHFGLNVDKDIKAAIDLYLRILDLKESDIKYNIAPLSGKELHSIQGYAANNMSILYNEGFVDMDIALSNPLLRWKIEYINNVDLVHSYNTVIYDVPQIEFSVLMALCFTIEDFPYLEDLLDDDAILIVYDTGNIRGKREIIEYFKRHMNLIKQKDIECTYSLKNFTRHNTWALQIETEQYATSTLIGYIRDNKVIRIVLLHESWEENNNIYHTELNRETSTDYNYIDSLSFDTIFRPYALPCPYCGKLSSLLKWKNIEAKSNVCTFINNQVVPEISDMAVEKNTPETNVYMSVCPDCHKEVEYITHVRYDQRKKIF